MISDKSLKKVFNLAKFENQKKIRATLILKKKKSIIHSGKYGKTGLGT